MRIRRRRAAARALGPEARERAGVVGAMAADQVVAVAIAVAATAAAVDARPVAGVPVRDGVVRRAPRPGRAAAGCRAGAAARSGPPRRRRSGRPSASRSAGSSCCARERNWRATSAWPALSPESCSDEAHHASCGGIGGGGANRGPRSLITTVPAKMSPMRLALGDKHAADHRGAAQQHPDLDDRRQRAKQRLPEAFRAAVVRHHAQAHHDLADRAAPRRGFEHQGIPNEHQHREDDHDRAGHCVVELGQRGRPQHQAQAGSRRRSRRCRSARSPPAPAAGRSARRAPRRPRSPPPT